VCFGFDISGKITALTRHYAGSRDRIRWIAANFALDTIRKLLNGSN
jgi:nicotinamide mononucleotide (NMN) deamidase PncC